MLTVAEQLRTAREAQGLTVYQVAEITKIKTDHVRALEEGDYAAFAAPVYIRGFVRTYGTLLRLEVATLLSALEAELDQTEKFHEPPPLSDESGRFLDVVSQSSPFSPNYLDLPRVHLNAISAVVRLRCRSRGPK